MTVNQAASRLGLDHTRVQKLCKAKRIRATKHFTGARQWRYDISVDAIKEFKANRRKAA